MSRPFVAKLLHVYGQEEWHHDLVVLGNRDGLVALRDTIDRALLGAGEVRAEVTKTGDEPFASDGEGFAIVVMRDDSEWTGDRWQAYGLPYTESYAKSGDDALWPHRIWRDWVAGRMGT